MAATPRVRRPQWLAARADLPGLALALGVAALTRVLRASVSADTPTTGLDALAPAV